MKGNRTKGREECTLLGKGRFFFPKGKDSGKGSKTMKGKGKMEDCTKARKRKEWLHSEKNVRGKGREGKKVVKEEEWNWIL